MRGLTWLRPFGLEHPSFDKDVPDAALWLPASKERGAVGATR